MSNKIIEMMNECGADALSVDIKNNLVESRKKINNDVLLFENFDVYELPCKEETTVQQAVKAIKVDIDGGVDAVWTGCDLWPAIKEENMRAIVETAREYGKKPSPALGRLNLPQCCNNGLNIGSFSCDSIFSSSLLRCTRSRAF
jgi:[methyl-Co(III) methanol-specific corrinoid protein]:coenzyme M methyltransferase